MKKAHWQNVHIYEPARKEILEWPSSVKKELGGVLTRLQKGEYVGMPDVRAMPSVTRGAAEIRIKDESGIYRAFFIVWHESGILVFHSFKKKSEATPHQEIETAKARLRKFIEELGL